MSGALTRSIGRTPAAAAGPDANTLFLCRFTTNPPTDEVRNVTGTVSGNPTFGSNSIVLDGTGDWVSFAGHANFNVTANWTLEFHTNMAAAQFGGIVGNGPSGSGRMTLFGDGTGNLTLYNQPGVGANGMVDGSKHHIAVCRDGGTWRFYKDGVQIASHVNATAPGDNSASAFLIGTDPFDPTSRDVAATIWRMKISNVCRYPSGTTFTPPGDNDL